MLETKRHNKVEIMTYNGQTMLEDVIRGLGHDPKLIPVEKLQEIAERLCQVARGETPPSWSWRYLRNVLNGKLDASQRLSDAIMRLGASIDGAAAEAVKGERVMVLALGQVEAGAVVLGSSKRCGNPACKIVFVPVVPWQKCHSAACAKGWREERKRSAVSAQPSARQDVRKVRNNGQ